MTPLSARPLQIEYPDSDGMPTADNSLQFRWIVTIEGNLESVFRDNSGVFVAGDMLWYPVEGNNKIRIAPDAMVAVGRPKGYRGSYRQWEEEGIPPQVVFEVLPPGNRVGEMTRKFEFYRVYGVEEYYLYDPDANILDGWIRNGDQLKSIESIDGWRSPRLGIRFELQPDNLVIYRPDGDRFLTFEEIGRELDAVKQRAEEDRMARIQAQARADVAQQQSVEAKQRSEVLAAKLRALGVDPDAA